MKMSTITRKITNMARSTIKISNTLSNTGILHTITIINSLRTTTTSTSLTNNNGKTISNNVTKGHTNTDIRITKQTRGQSTTIKLRTEEVTRTEETMKKGDRSTKRGIRMTQNTHPIGKSYASRKKKKFRRNLKRFMF